MLIRLTKCRFFSLYLQAAMLAVLELLLVVDGAFPLDRALELHVRINKVAVGTCLFFPRRFSARRLP